MSAKGASKTNAVRILERMNIEFTTREYPVDEAHLDAQHVADSIGEDINQVYKTLVLRGDRHGILVCVIAGNREVDLKKIAKVSGNKKVEMIHLKELQPLTGYIRGGCTAIGMKKQFPTFLSQDAMQLDNIYISAGKRGMQICISPADFIKAAAAQTADITCS